MNRQHFTANVAAVAIIVFGCASSFAQSNIPQAKAVRIISAGEMAEACKATYRFLDQNTHPAVTSIDHLAVEQYMKCGRAFGLSDASLSSSKVAHHGAWVCVLNEDYCYTLDQSGNFVFRRVSNVPAIVDGLSTGVSPVNVKSRNQIEYQAKQIAIALAIHELDHCKSFGKKELLFSAKCGVSFNTFGGRSLVRLVSSDNGGYFQLTVDNQGNPCSIESSFIGYSKIAISKFMSNATQGSKLIEECSPVTLGTFYSTQEHRFQDVASSFEGYQLGDIKFLDGADGQIRLSQHAPLSQFTLEEPVRRGSYRRISQQFYNKIEGCNVAIFATHAGPVNGAFQLDQGLGGDTWFAIGGTRNKFGSGNLRHMIFQSCGALSFFSEQKPDNRVLVNEWMRGGTVSGLRTVCGYDGNGASDGRNGPAFLQSYIVGCSISSSWLSASMNENNGHDLQPVTIAYGGDLAEAIKSLADGRFSNKAVGAAYCVGSLWRDF